jgi:signal transduction histidine kinase/ligand-binding sensor domain-containing protein
MLLASAISTLTRPGVVAAVCLCLSEICQAQTPEPEYVIRSWDIRDGLNHGSINAVQRTKDGYLLLETRRGLLRFDGTQFKTFNPWDSATSQTNDIRCSLDHAGSFWFATPDGLFNLSTERKEGSRITKAQVPGVESLLAGPGGTVFAKTASNQIVRFSPGKQPAILQPPYAARIQAEGLTASNCLAIATGRELWVEKEGQFIRWPWVDGDSAPERITRIATSRGGGVWLASGERVLRVRESERSFWPQVKEGVAPRAAVTAILEDRHGRLWAGASSGGIYCFDMESGWRHVSPRRSRSFGAVSALYEDAEGAIWVGTSAGILHQVKLRVVSTWSLPATAQENVPQTVCVAKDGAVWIGTDGAGVYRFKEGAFSHYGPEHGLSNSTVIAILEDRQTNLWFGTYGGLFRLSEEKFLPELEAPLNGRSVPTLFQDSAGDLWIGSVGCVLRKSPARTVQFELGPGNERFEIRAIAEGPNGQLWIGSRGGGLFRFADGRMEKVPFFNRPVVMALHRDAEGVLWVGTLNNGLFRLQGDELRHWFIRDGLPSNTLYAVAEDERGNLWLNSNAGVFGLTKQALEHYQPGLTAPLVNIHLAVPGLADRGTGSGQPAVAFSPDGRLWFPLEHGLVTFNPAMLIRERPNWPLIIEGVSADGVEQPLIAGRPVKLLSGARRLEVRYTVADLDAPARLKFRYKLEGLDDQWVEAGWHRSASYGALPPGRYQFQVMYSGSQDTWRGMAEPLVLDIVPRYWERRWFQALCAFVVLGGATASARAVERSRTKRKVERLELQQTMEKERRRIAQDLHDDLGAGLTEIMLLGELAKRNDLPPREAQAQISTMTDKARRLASAMDEVVWTVNPKNDSVPNLASYICDYAREFFRASAARCRIDMPPELPPITLAAQARHNLFLAVKEALSNAAKHSGAAEVWLHLRCDAHHFVVTVEDNGRGFVPEETSRNGLKNMHQRLLAAGGRTELSSHPGQGTTVRFLLPLEGTERPELKVDMHSSDLPGNHSIER